MPLSKLNPRTNLWILETSSFNLHYTRLATPMIYALLPVSSDHINWHGSEAKYLEAKLKFIARAKQCLIPANYGFRASKNIHTYESMQSLNDSFGISLDRLKEANTYLSSFFAFNACFALALEKIFKGTLSYEKLRHFNPPAHRLELFYDAHGRAFINDSKSTNVSSTIFGIRQIFFNNSNNMDKRLIIILGGDSKSSLDLKSLNELFNLLKMLGAEALLIGKDAEIFLQCARQWDVAAKTFSTLNELMHVALKMHGRNSILMLSPACASFDLFNSYKQRGEIFKNLALSNN